MSQKEDRATVVGLCTENLANFGRLVFDIRERTDRQTDRHTDTLNAILRTLLCRDRLRLFTRIFDSQLSCDYNNFTLPADLDRGARGLSGT